MLSDDLEAMAAEELGQAAALPWRQLASLIPWGDTFTGIAPSGLSVEIERGYLWAGAEGGDILCEVRVYLDQAHYEYGARQSRLIPRPVIE